MRLSLPSRGIDITSREQMAHLLRDRQWNGTGASLLDQDTTHMYFVKNGPVALVTVPQVKGGELCATTSERFNPHDMAMVGDDLEVPLEACISIDLMVEIAQHFYATRQLLDRGRWRTSSAVREDWERFQIDHIRERALRRALAPGGYREHIHCLGELIGPWRKAGDSRNEGRRIVDLPSALMERLSGLGYDIRPASWAPPADETGRRTDPLTGRTVVLHVVRVELVTDDKAAVETVYWCHGMAAGGLIDTYTRAPDGWDCSEQGEEWAS